MRSRNKDLWDNFQEHHRGADRFTGKKTKSDTGLVESQNIRVQIATKDDLEIIRQIKPEALSSDIIAQKPLYTQFISRTLQLSLPAT